MAEPKHILKAYWASGIASLAVISSFLIAIALGLFWSLKCSLVEDVAARVVQHELEIETISSATDLVFRVTEDRKWLGLHDSPGFVDFLLSPSLKMLLKGEGDCGNMSLLLKEVLTDLDFESRPALVLDKNGKTIHVILQVALTNGVAYVDPSFNWVYKAKDGTPLFRSEFEHEWHKNVISCGDSGITRYPISHGLGFTNWSRFGLFEQPTKVIVEKVTRRRFQDVSVREVLPGWYASRMIVLVTLFLFITFMLVKISAS